MGIENYAHLIGGNMTSYQILCLIGVPTIISSLLSATIATIKQKKNKITEENIQTEQKLLTVQLGLQALLRANMINDYNRWNEKGYAPIYARENFENCWKQYHTLGANGVMDDIHKKFMELPTSCI